VDIRLPGRRAGDGRDEGVRRPRRAGGGGPHEAGLFAFEGYCTHEECPLAEGILTDRELECYCHGAIFDLRTGEALVGPALSSLQTYPVREQEGEIQVEL